MPDTPSSTRTSAATAAAAAKRKADRLTRLADELTAEGYKVISPDPHDHTLYPPDAETYARDMVNHVPQEYLVAATIATTLGARRHSFRAILDEALARWKHEDA